DSGAQRSSAAIRVQLAHLVRFELIVEVGVLGVVAAGIPVAETGIELERDGLPAGGVASVDLERARRDLEAPRRRRALPEAAELCPLALQRVAIEKEVVLVLSVSLLLELVVRRFDRFLVRELQRCP